ncbi:phosphoribosyltransferase family protein [Curtobacterium sp. SORGH_AS_0776]|uniref:ComF family protein n=2 Tax=unclassified Curtobacterium TaxID=257496 RepID=UPI002856B20F|nr:phosphoribosyltransferase family protein [Curtobacterium sp. SORGH_AS_0776]MDR6172124.1 putative amidophosphoribosyltransferase [Curtobacterium sp. SORGH_AS_0776]
MTTRDSLRPWLDAAVAVLGLFLPVDCVGCGRPDRALCAACRHALDAMPRRVRLVAGVRLDAAFEYTGLVRTMLLELKLRGRVDLARPLGARFGGLVRAALADAGPGAVLLRVPPSRQGARRRGFDPVVLLAARGGVRRSRAMSRLRTGGLARRRAGAGVGAGVAVGAGAGAGAGAGVGIGADAVHGGQKERSAVERVAATVGTLSVTGVTGRAVVVVDDVVTTGVTMAEAVRAVRAAGGRVVRCVAVASVDD